MTEATAKKTVWNPPRMSTGPDGVSRIDFRDCIVELQEGAVARYFDKQRSVSLCPGAQLDNWEVFAQTGAPSGQFWRGIIAFDGSQLLIQQARNSLFRVYRTDGEIETQLRISRVIERPGMRRTLFQQGLVFEEDLLNGAITSRWYDCTIARHPDGEVTKQDLDGNELAEVDESERETYDNPTLDIFSRFLSPWQKFAAVGGYTEFVYGGPPGLAEAEPGEPFALPCAGKPDDVRECLKHDFGNGTILYEYVGRLATPFLAHEVVTYDGAIIARMVEYDQPKSIMFCDPRGLLRQHEGVIKVEVQYDPGENEYITCITYSNGTEFIHPKGARFDRGESGPT